MNITDFAKLKTQQEKICMITCYDFTSAKLIANTAVDCILVGDSVAMTMHGFADTIHANVDMMCMHIAAVKRGAANKFIIGDLPFLSYRKSLNQNMTAVQRLMQAGAHAVKLEGADGNLKLIKHLTESGVPVMGHLGLTPQSVHMLGGFKVQGKTNAAAKKLLTSAMELQNAGCFAIVLECVPSVLAKEITQQLDIPTIGIGAGMHTDGQVLVFHDLLGLQNEFQPKFLKVFVDGYGCLRDGVEKYVKDVKDKNFPTSEIICLNKKEITREEKYFYS